MPDPTVDSPSTTPASAPSSAPVAQKPTMGRVVIFKLDDATRERIEACGNLGIDPNNGGATCCADVVSVSPDGATVNLRLKLDGPPSPAEWKTSVPFGDQPGQWSWPPRA